jgi:hypothetical protein
MQIFVNEPDEWPIKYVLVRQYCEPECKGGRMQYDQLALAKYMHELRTGHYEPISVSWRFSSNRVLDGSHRIEAARRLNLHRIKAHVDPTPRFSS